jgi:hypothetical protein
MNGVLLGKLTVIYRPDSVKKIEISALSRAHVE